MGRHCFLVIIVQRSSFSAVSSSSCYFAEPSLSSTLKCCILYLYLVNVNFSECRINLIPHIPRTYKRDEFWLAREEGTLHTRQNPLLLCHPDGRVCIAAALRNLSMRCGYSTATPQPQVIKRSIELETMKMCSRSTSRTLLTRPRWIR